jgi:hypothetical protein
MRHCDSCQKIIPMGNDDRIEVSFRGKFAKLLKSVYGDSDLEFCCLTCFNKFKVPENKEH